ncbi:MAG: PD-(D/E)XK nuclease family protein, partial [Oscillospiraceae bacterium]|nr:PD-(D/E)XK nuclease family protein [Oscillospiraceae bacterium]
ETRNLDFDHLLLLSCNEGIMPKGGSDISVIPYNVKKAFGLNTADDRTNIYAYYFYRLLKRCPDVTLVYNAGSSETSPGEMSRFLLDLIVSVPGQIRRKAIGTYHSSRTKLPQEQEKTAADLERYLSTLRHLSPTAINLYMRCQKQFYYKYFRGLQEEKDEEDSMDAAAFGSFFHNTAEDFYSKFVGVSLDRAMLQPYIDKPALLEPHINRALEKTKAELYKEGAASIESGGMEELMKSIVKSYMRRLLRNDQQFAPFTIIGLEQTFYEQISIPNAGAPLKGQTIEIGGAVDRLDLVTDSLGRQTLRVVDYKSGTDKSHVKMADMDDIFSTPDGRTEKDGSDYYRQTILYSLAVSSTRARQGEPAYPVAPALYYIRNGKLGSEEAYDPTLSLGGKPITDVEQLREDFEQRLHSVVHDIFTRETFKTAADPTACSTCPFAGICR